MAYTNLTYHIVYSTKERIGWLSPALLDRMVKYTGGVVRKAGGRLLVGGGAEDHVHWLATLPASRAVADCVRDMKSNSSRWVHNEWPGLKGFTWQEAYAAFSVSCSERPRVERYIAGQAQHHRKMDFIEELRALLDRHGVEYDPEYLV
ncbi:MAG: IS200/IS605 family transposase [Phycisphaerae bacterium]